jgi:probable DNA metabolism protein
VPDKSNLVYCYDGSFDGFLSCVFESYLKKETPCDIFSEEEAEPTLFRQKWVETNMEHAERVFTSMETKISPSASKLVQDGFLTCAPRRELLLLRFLRQGYQYGGTVINRLADPDVAAVMDAVKFLQNEAHLYLGFVRFSSQNGTLASVISPKNCVLPLIRAHFCSRFNAETFLIYDRTHHMALIHRPGKDCIVPLEYFTLPEPNAEEAGYQRLWKQFYDTIAVEGRENPRCRMTHIPKRYWADTVELSQSRSLLSVKTENRTPHLHS